MKEIKHLSNPDYSQFIALSRYSRWLPEEGRREYWGETVGRYINFFRGRNPLIPEEVWEELYSAIYSMEVMPSMRALMTAGEALERDNVASLNCSYTTIEGSGETIKVTNDQIEALVGEPLTFTIRNPICFDEVMYILMCGTGVGFSVERQYINNLPKVGDQVNRGIYLPLEENFPGVPKEEISTLNKEDNTIHVHDSKYGWSSALRILTVELYNGNFSIGWDLSQIREKGAPLKTFGGRASGPDPLNDLFLFAKQVFEPAKGRKLTSIECHDLLCKIGAVVVVGGVRRCLPLNSPVQMESGFKKIQDIQRGDMVESGGKKGRVIASVPSGRQEIYRIHHQYGYLDCTGNHEVATYNSDVKIEFKAASLVTAKDTLVWDSRGYTGRSQELPQLLPTPGGAHFNSKEFRIPELDGDVSWLFGLIHGDGYISKKGIEITVADHEVTLLERANAVFSRFQLSGTISDGNGNCKRLRVNSVGLSAWFCHHIKEPNKDISIPDFILNNTKGIRAAYLAGVFDSDGRSRKDNVIEQVTSVYPKFSKSIARLLLSLGIAPQLVFNSAQRRRDIGIAAKDFYNVNIRGITNRENWLRLIAGWSKGEKLSNTTISSGNGNDFKYSASMLGSPNGWKPLGNITLHSAVKGGFVEKSVFYPTQVSSVESVGSKETFDIEVETLHSFTTSGLLVHNSACISLSNLTDLRMQKAKSGRWFDVEPQRALANNSVAYTEKPDPSIFLKEFVSLIESKSGERGFFNRVAAKSKVSENGRRDPNWEFGLNPCGEIILRPHAFCNLTEGVIRSGDTYGEIARKLRLATILGTLQATLTDFRYLSSEWRKNTEEEALLGVSMTGIMDHPVMAGVIGGDGLLYLDEGLCVAPRWFDAKSTGIQLSDILWDLKQVCIDTNVEWARKLGINAAAAITTVKPSGTVSQLTDTSSGIHGRFSPYYIRTVRADKKDPISQFMIEKGVPYEENVMKGQDSWIFSFPMKSPEGSLLTEDRSAIEQLEHWLVYRRHWTEHNPSITIFIKEGEWTEVAAWVYKHFDEVSGISFLPQSNHSYLQAPYQAITQEEYEELVIKMPSNINWEGLSDYEEVDTTAGASTLACTGGICEVVDLEEF